MRKSLKIILSVLMMLSLVSQLSSFSIIDTYAEESDDIIIGESATLDDYENEEETEVNGVEEYDLGQSKVRSTTSNVTSGDFGDDGDNLSWSFDEDNGILSITGSGKMEDFDSISSIPWYSYRSSITSITLSDDITYIGEAAFYNCSEIETIVFPSNLQSLGTAVFANCYNLSNVTINEGLTNLPEYTFQSTAIKNISLPSTIETVYALTFYQCEVAEYNVSENNNYYCSIDGVIYSKDKKTLIAYPVDKSDRTYTINSTTTTINEYAFGDCNNLKTVTIPSSVTTLENSVFYRSSLTSLTIPDSVTSIGDYLCEYSTNLKSIIIGSGVTELSYAMLYGCSSLTDLEFGDSITYIDTYACSYTSLVTLELGDSITEIGHQAFSYCDSLKTVKLGNSITIIRNGAFGECSALTSISIPSSVETIAYQAFLNCTSLSNVELSEGLKYIYSYAFYNTAITSVTIPSTVKEIAEHAFPDSASLTLKNDNLSLCDNGAYLELYEVSVSAKYLYSEAYDALDIVSEERAAEGLSALTMDKELLEAAMQRAVETSIYWSHTRANGLDCFTISDLMSGENIAAGNTNATSVMNSWMNSSGHKANILDSDFESIGIGAVYVDGTYYWVQCFGTGSASTVAQPADTTKITSVEISTYNDDLSCELSLSTPINIGNTSQAELLFYNTWVYTAADSSCLSFSSSSTDIATVNSSGTITGKSAGTATISSWLTDYKDFGVFSDDITVKTKSISECTATLGNTSYTYTSAAIKPNVTVKDGNTTLESGTDYTVSYSNNINVGTGTVTITGKGNYTGTLKKTFSIVNKFVDVKDSSIWYYNTVYQSYAAGLMTGTDDTHFAPNKNMSRAMVVTVLYRMAGSPKVSSSSKFTDVKNGIWYTNAITWATNLGIVSGYGNGKFGPEDDVTREQMAVMIRNYCQIYKKYKTTSTNDLTSFTDYKNVSSYAKTALGWAVDKGIISGTESKKLNPKSKATRAECAKMLLQASKLKS